MTRNIRGTAITVVALMFAGCAGNKPQRGESLPAPEKLLTYEDFLELSVEEIQKLGRQSGTQEVRKEKPAAVPALAPASETKRKFADLDMVQTAEVTQSSNASLARLIRANGGSLTVKYRTFATRGEDIVASAYLNSSDERIFGTCTVNGKLHSPTNPDGSKQVAATEYKETGDLSLVYYCTNGKIDSAFAVDQNDRRTPIAPNFQ